MSIKQKSGDRGELDIQAIENRSSFVTLKDRDGNNATMREAEKVSTTQSYLPIAAVNDSQVIPVRVDRLGNQMIGKGRVQIFDNFPGSTLNTQKWVASTVSFTTGVGSTGYNLNNSNATTTNAYNIITTLKQFIKVPRIPLQIKARIRMSTVSNSVVEVGFGAPTTNTAIITNSAHWRMSGSSSVVPVLTFNGSEITGSPVDLSAETANFFVFDVIVDDDGATFTIHNTQTDTFISYQKLSVQKSWAKMWNVTRLQGFCRLYNTAAPPATAPAFIVSEIMIIDHDLDLPRPWLHTIAMNAMGSHTTPDTWVSAANYTNSAAPTSATLSNTAAGYTTLGGQFQFAAVAGAETDYCLFGFTVPTGYQFVCTGIKIETFNMGAAVATTPTLLQWGIGANGTAVSLAAGAHIRKALGTQSLPIGAAIGADSNKVINETFDTPLVTESGRFFAVILKMPVGTATASQIIRGVVDVRGYYE